MKQLALGAGIFIVTELLLITLLGVDEWAMMVFSAGVIITILLLIFMRLTELVKSNRDRLDHQQRQRIQELNRQSRLTSTSDNGSMNPDE
ncbi:hypothetical protein SAMN04488688_101772 [Paenibacillus sp. cl141a]|uniref:hypothetical protein n=1 Tax=Bacillales TaxID=1385 RepID=UPI0008D431DB|nr:MULTISPECIES: hypothetical protein [Paenibacillus]PCL93608.1 hypothetical protein CPZ30_09215 [Paenibacillus lautus]QOT11795.1 hypothetical protein JNUCC32_07150 [Paenibacillus sp. JNUCC-32]WFB56126.1 hypothetical protein P0X86_19125 [Paenibacillus sp. BR1-192]SEK44597.1 hypothetical protein SAMN04488688_101772 [Paenibacillus sp. cl141a]GIP03730.1 hypothetical protein J28TS4_21370 [Paenibacillus lautus]